MLLEVIAYFDYPEIRVRRTDWGVEEDEKVDINSLMVSLTLFLNVAIMWKKFAHYGNWLGNLL